MLGADKLFLMLGDRPVLAHAVQPFQDSELVHQIVLVVGAGKVTAARRLARKLAWSKVTAVRAGGARRQDSVARGLARIADSQWVLVHDGARPFVDGEMIRGGLEAARQTGAAVAAVPVKDTIKVARGGLVTGSPDRDELWVAQTPQVFRYDIISRAYSSATEEATDDAVLVERLGIEVRLFPGSYENIKITTPDDLGVAEAILKARTGVKPASRGRVRVGIGYDVHRLVEGRRLVLGGVVIPFGRGLEGHSDADVLLHSIMDALLGAAGLRDIGFHFPPTDVRYRDISSVKLLAKVSSMIAERGWRAVNVDATVVAQEPQLSGHIERMRRRIGRTLRLGAGEVGIKATTAEGLGFAGRGEGIAAFAVAMLEQEAP